VRERAALPDRRDALGVNQDARSCYTGPMMRQQTGTASYDTDLALWAEEQATALRARRLEDLDTENLAAEIGALTARDMRAIQSHMRSIMLHSLKLKYQPEKATASWRTSIVNASVEIDDIVRASPSLRNFVTESAGLAYDQARKMASAETGLPLATFPAILPQEFGEAFQSTLAGK
jgi:hypothetical protein